MESTAQCLTADELEQAMKSMVKVRDLYGSEISKLGNPNFVAQQLFQMSQRGQVIKYYNHGRFVGIMVFDVAFLWWLDRPVLIEQLVLACDSESVGVQRAALDTLDMLAMERYPQVCAICSGCLFNATQSQMVINGYKKHGYTQTAPTTIKIIEGR